MAVCLKTPLALSVCLSVGSQSQYPQDYLYLAHDPAHAEAARCVRRRCFRRVVKGCAFPVTHSINRSLIHSLGTHRHAHMKTNVFTVGD
jgi:hypothetical protein